jgi:hypothetical protein
VIGCDFIKTKAFGESRSENVHVLLEKYAGMKIQVFEELAIGLFE